MRSHKGETSLSVQLRSGFVLSALITLHVFVFVSSLCVDIHDSSQHSCQPQLDTIA